MAVQVDDKDIAILDILKEDSRSSVRTISKKTGIRPSTVHTRIQRMQEKGVIRGFSVDLAPEKVGEGLTVYMLVAGTLEGYLDDAFLNSKHIKEISGITGEYDLLMKLAFKDMKQFNRFVIDFRKRYSQSVSKTITMVRTVELK